MLYLIGLGLELEDISLKALNAIKSCNKVYLESYTSTGAKVKELEDLLKKKVIIAERELMAEVLPITINRPMPKRRDEKIKTLTKEQIDEIKRKEAELKAIEEAKAEKEAEEATNKEAPLQAGEAKEDEQLVSEEETEEKKITEEGEIMELANPEDEASDIEGGSESEEI